jgi:hypothetical protein
VRPDDLFNDGRPGTGDGPTLGGVLVPVLLPIALGVAGWFTAGWAGAVTALGVGLLIDVAVVAGAAVWARQIGSLLEPQDAWAAAPRPPGYRRLTEWVYERTLR